MLLKRKNLWRGKPFHVILLHMDMPLVVQNLSKNYGQIQAVRNASFSLNPGEIFGLLGPNGAGKTTIISSIVTLENPTSGAIEVFGVDNQKNPQKAKMHIGFVPQELIHHGYFSVEEILQFHGYFYGIKVKKPILEDLLKRLDLWNHRGKLVAQLSGGMKRRLLIAKALIHNPSVILLDEPTAGVDIELRTTLWKYIEELREDGKSILLTTHYLEEAEALCDRIAILRKGEILRIDSTKNLLNDLTNRNVIILLNKPLPSITHPQLLTQSDEHIKFQLSRSNSLGDLLDQLKLEAGIIKDIHIREGNLEDAFQRALRDDN